MWPGQENPPIVQQPGFNPNFPTAPGQPYPPQQFPMHQYPPQQGYPPPGQPIMYPPPGQPMMYPQPQQPGPYNNYPPQQPGQMYPQQMPYGPQQPMMGQQQQQGGGIMGKVMGVLNDVVDVNPMNSMHSTGNMITGYKSPPVMPCKIRNSHPR